jgi:hypothetical protein
MCEYFYEAESFSLWKTEIFGLLPWFFADSRGFIANFPKFAIKCARLLSARLEHDKNRCAEFYVPESLSFWKTVIFGLLPRFFTDSRGCIVKLPKSFLSARLEHVKNMCLKFHGPVPYSFWKTTFFRGFTMVISQILENPCLVRV